MTQTVLVNQPSAAPTRKMAAVGIAGLVAPIVAGALVSILPGLSEACGQEAGLAVTVVGVGLAQGGLTFLAGYLRRNEAKTV